MELTGQLLLVTEMQFLQNLPSILNFSIDHWKTKSEDDFKNPSRGRTSTIPRLPERFSGQDSSRPAGGGGPGRGEQVGQQGREEESGATGGEETDRSTSTALTSAGLSTYLNPAIHLLSSWNIILLPYRYKAPWQEQARTDIPTQAGGRLVDITARPTRSTRREESRRPITRISFFCRRSKMLNHPGLSWLLSPIDGLNFKVMYKHD